MYRKSRSRASFKRSGSRFSRSHLRTVQPTQRWQRANFFIEQNTLHDAVGAWQNVVFSMAQIAGKVGDETVPTGRALTQIARTMEVGGIVFDWRMTGFPDRVATAESNDTFEECRLEQQLLLCTDRLTNDSLPSPVAINVNWFTNTTPIVPAQSTQTDDQDTSFPTRVHWRKHVTQDDTTVVYPAGATGRLEEQRQSFPVVLSSGSKNLRLRLRLRDTETLVFHWATQLSAYNSLFNDAYYARLVIAGSLYYRVRF